MKWNRENHRPTKNAPFAMVYSFMNAVFNIEKPFTSDRTSISSSRYRELYHVTKADLQLAMILQKVCDTRGVVSEVRRHHIYEEMRLYFEDPVCAAQFYIAFDKFVQLQLITETYVTETGLYWYQLHHYVQEETGTIGNFVVAHPYFYSRRFSLLSVSEQKFILSLFLSQGIDARSKGIQEAAAYRYFHTEHHADKDLQHSGLCNFMHRHAAQIRSICDRIAKEKAVNGKPLIRKLTYIKRGKQYDKLIVQLEPSLFSTPKLDEYHESVTPKLVYKRKARLIERIIETYRMGELLTWNGGREFLSIVRLLKGYGARVIRYVMSRLYELYLEKRLYQSNIRDVVLKELRSKVRAKILGFAHSTGIYNYVVYKTEGERREEREYQFASRFSIYGDTLVERMFRSAAPEIRRRFSRPIVPGKGNLNYSFDPRLDGIEQINFIRYSAARQKKNVTAYLELEKLAYERYQKNVQPYYQRYDMERGNKAHRVFVEWMLEQIDQLPDIDVVPAVPPGIILEDFIINHYEYNVQ